jgi:PhnB protein
MTAKAKPIPEKYHTVTPYLIVHDAVQAIEFYKRAFGAVELFRMAGPGGKVGHAEIRIGDSNVMLADEHPEMGARSPRSIGGSPVSMLVYVENVDAFFNQAVSAGAKVVRPIENKFYGDRSGGLEDPFGYQWFIATHIEDLSPEELQRRAASAH